MINGDPKKLLSLIDTGRLKASEEDLLRSLNGLYKDQFVVILGNLLRSYDFFKTEMKSYELLMEGVLQKMLPIDEQGNKPVVKAKTRYTRKNQYSINLKMYLKHILGVDTTKVDGLDEITVLTILSVTGVEWVNGRQEIILPVGST